MKTNSLKDMKRAKTEDHADIFQAIGPNSSRFKNQLKINVNSLEED